MPFCFNASHQGFATRCSFTYGSFKHGDYVEIAVHPVTGNLLTRHDPSLPEDRLIALQNALRAAVVSLPSNYHYCFNISEIMTLELNGTFSLGELLSADDFQIWDNSLTCTLILDASTCHFQAYVCQHTGALTFTIDGSPISADDQDYFEKIFIPHIDCVYKPNQALAQAIYQDNIASAA
jgi:hypothetical protein